MAKLGSLSIHVKIKSLGFGLTSTDPQTITTAARIAAISDYGYTLSPAQFADLNTKYKNFRRNLGRIPLVWHDADISTNRNLLTTTGTPATQTTGSLATGTYTLHVTGSGSAATSAGTATITGAGTASAGSDNTITVTVAGTVTVTVTGSLTFFQLERGSTFTTANSRTGTTAVKSLNLGTGGAAGDGTFTNGTSGSMIDLVGTRRVYKFVQVSSQSIVTAQNGAAGSAARFMFGFANRVSNVSGYAVGYFTSGSDRSVLRQDTTPNLYPQVDSTSGTGTTAPATGTWYSQAMTYAGGASSNLGGFISGVRNTTNTMTAATTAAVIRFAGDSTGSIWVNGSLNHLMYDANGYSDAQVLAVHNFLKADLGL